MSRQYRAVIRVVVYDDESGRTEPCMESELPNVIFDAPGDPRDSLTAAALETGAYVAKAWTRFA